MSYSNKELWERSAKEISVSKKEFDVTITEVLKKTVTVEADSLEEAEQMVSDDWHKGEYILDADDFVDVEFSGKEGLRKPSLDKQMSSAEAASAVSIKPDCPLIGQDGNIFNLMGIASLTLRQNGLPEQAKEMSKRIVDTAQSYDEALCIIGEYVNITSEDKMLRRDTVLREANEL